MTFQIYTTGEHKETFRCDADDGDGSFLRNFSTHVHGIIFQKTRINFRKAVTLKKLKQWAMLKIAAQLIFKTISRNLQMSTSVKFESQNALL
jgi:hypothetical protein